MRRWGVVLGLVVCGCAGETVQSTTVDGAASGVSFESPHAFFNLGKGLFNEPVAVILISDDAQACSDLRVPPGQLFGQQVVVGLNARPSLLLAGGSGATLDTGELRVAATSAKIDTSGDDLERRGRFTAKFPDGTLSGTIVASRCTQLETGCSTAGGAPFLGAALAWLARRRGRWALRR